MSGINNSWMSDKGFIQILIKNYSGHYLYIWGKTYFRECLHIYIFTWRYPVLYNTLRIPESWSNVRNCKSYFCCFLCSCFCLNDVLFIKLNFVLEVGCFLNLVLLLPWLEFPNDFIFSKNSRSLFKKCTINKD